jgi:prevent-host-death family protein
MGIRELRVRLRDAIDRVAAGEPVTVVRHGRAIARIVPAVEERRPRLESLRDFRASLSAPRRPLSEAVLEERRAARY